MAAEDYVEAISECRGSFGAPAVREAVSVKPPAPFPAGRKMYTMKEITDVCSAVGFRPEAFMGLHPHPFPPAVERRHPYLYLPTEENLSAAQTYWQDYAFYTPLERLFRKVRDTVLSTDDIDATISSMFASMFDEQAFVTEYFVDWAEVLEMASAGMEIGAHGNLHLIDTQASSDAAANDARRAIDILNSRLPRPVRSYAYPYGLYMPETVRAIGEGGLMAGFTCNPGIAYSESFLTIDRLDTRMFPLSEEDPLCEWSERELRLASHRS